MDSITSTCARLHAEVESHQQQQQQQHAASLPLPPGLQDSVDTAAAFLTEHLSGDHAEDINQSVEALQALLGTSAGTSGHTQSSSSSSTVSIMAAAALKKDTLRQAARLISLSALDRPVLLALATSLHLCVNHLAPDPSPGCDDLADMLAVVIECAAISLHSRFMYKPRSAAEEAVLAMLILIFGTSSPPSLHLPPDVLPPPHATPAAAPHDNSSSAPAVAPAPKASPSSHAASSTFLQALLLGGALSGAATFASRPPTSPLSRGTIAWLLNHLATTLALRLPADTSHALGEAVGVLVSGCGHILHDTAGHSEEHRLDEEVLVRSAVHCLAALTGLGCWQVCTGVCGAGLGWGEWVTSRGVWGGGSG